MFVMTDTTTTSNVNEASYDGVLMEAERHGYRTYTNGRFQTYYAPDLCRMYRFDVEYGTATITHGVTEAPCS